MSEPTKPNTPYLCDSCHQLVAETERHHKITIQNSKRVGMAVTFLIMGHDDKAPTDLACVCPGCALLALETLADQLRAHDEVPK